VGGWTGRADEETDSEAALQPPQFDLNRSCVELVLDEMIDQVVAHRTEVFEKVIFCETSGDAATSSFRGKKVRAAGHTYAAAGAPGGNETLGAASRHLIDGPPTGDILLPFPLRDKPSTAAREPQPAPAKHLWDAVEALGSWTDLYAGESQRKIMAAVEAAGIAETEAAAGRPHAALPKPIILKWEAYSDLAKEVLEQGFTFEIDEQGRPHITIERRAEMGEGDMDVELIIEEALRLGCEDLEALDALRWGARAFCDTPLATTYGPNHAGALEHAAEMEGTMSDELRWGWIVSSKHPPFVPICVRPCSLIPKIKEVDGALKTTGYRLITDGSWPKPSRAGWQLVNHKGGLQAVAPNANFRAGSQPLIRYPAVSTLAQGIVPVMALSVMACEQLVGRCFDYAKWFRQIPMSNVDRWQIIEEWKGYFYHDRRVTVGTVHSSNICQRISFVLLQLVDKELDETFEAFLATRPWKTRAAVADWQAMRKQAYPDQPEQWRPYYISSYQDDTPAFALASMADWIDETFGRVMERLRVPVSTKTLPFDTVTEAIGGRFKLVPGEADVGPTGATMLDFKEKAAVVFCCSGGEHGHGKGGV